MNRDGINILTYIRNEESQNYIPHAFLAAGTAAQYSHVKFNSKWQIFQNNVGSFKHIKGTHT